MKIEEQGTEKFSDVKRGDIFKFNGNIFIKVREYYGINAVELATGFLYGISTEAEVSIYSDAKVVII